MMSTATITPPKHDCQYSPTGRAEDRCGVPVVEGTLHCIFHVRLVAAQVNVESPQIVGR